WEWRGIVEIKAAPGSCNFGLNTTAMGFYTPLQQARFQLDDAFNRLEKLTDADVVSRTLLMEEMRAYAGYADLLLGEGMCQMTIDDGPAMTREQVFALAESRFTDAIALAAKVTDSTTTAASVLNMALVGRARARLDLKHLPEAAADANAVPTGFVRNAKFTAGGSPIPIASWNEAQLIYAEAVGGQAGFDAINRVRAANKVPALAGAVPTGQAY